jgi:hypothetical protein
MDMRLDLFVLLSSSRIASQHLVANNVLSGYFYLLLRRHRSGWCRVFNIKHAESDVDVSLVHSASARDECAHNFMGERDFAARVTGSFVNDRRGSPAANKYEVK